MDNWNHGYWGTPVPLFIGGGAPLCFVPFSPSLPSTNWYGSTMDTSVVINITIECQCGIAVSVTASSYLCAPCLGRGRSDQWEVGTILDLCSYFVGVHLNWWSRSEPGNGTSIWHVWLPPISSSLLHSNQPDSAHSPSQTTHKPPLPSPYLGRWSMEVILEQPKSLWPFLLAAPLHVMAVQGLCHWWVTYDSRLWDMLSYMPYRTGPLV